MISKMKWSLFLITLMGQCCFITGQVYSYHYINMSKTWSDAQNYCRQKHTDLATVNNMRDMKRLLSKRPVNKEEAWIGLKNHTEANRTWHWSLPWVEYKENKEKWSSGEPNDQGGVENCVRMHNRKWQDVLCSHKLKFVCYNGKNASKEFFPINEEKTWLEAQRYCRKNHTDLISGVWQTAKLFRNETVPADWERFWIGLFRDTWRWSNGLGSYFRHWDVEFKDQPGNCAKIMLDEDGLWRNGNCTEKKPFFCYEERTSDLVTITNLDEQRWVQEKAKNASTPFVWLGLRYTCTLDFWFWVSDEVVGYDNWDSEKTDECDMFGAMKSGGQHEWVKQMDNQTFNFICSKN
ncbi:C-type mannose receptor 2-like isoform X1 [Embiotoca jacksoni]|uniref:C-type mannose receptor 2-like isoform X1 n=1 Tax=Embiotoca jacksoni TaxID=100190 RepID=UPI00370417F5